MRPVTMLDSSCGLLSHRIRQMYVQVPCPRGVDPGGLASHFLSLRKGLSGLRPAFGSFRGVGSNAMSPCPSFFRQGYGAGALPLSVSLSL